SFDVYPCDPPFPLPSSACSRSELSCRRSAPTELVSVERGLCTTRRRHLLPPPPSSSRWSAACALRDAAIFFRPHRARLGGARLVHYETPPSSSVPAGLAPVERGFCTIHCASGSRPRV